MLARDAVPTVPRFGNQSAVVQLGAEVCAYPPNCWHHQAPAAT
jgi:hypothetical protein